MSYQSYILSIPVLKDGNRDFTLVSMIHHVFKLVLKASTNSSHLSNECILAFKDALGNCISLLLVLRV